MKILITILLVIYSFNAIAEDCKEKRSCQRYNSYTSKCEAYQTEIRCNFEGEELYCKESCQHFDEFAHVCLYQTVCEFDNGCVAKTLCKEWSYFEKRCRKEHTRTVCL